MPKSLCLSAFHDIEMPIKYEIPRNEKSKIQNKKLKNSDERSVRVPNRVKRGCTPAKYDTNTPKKSHIINIM